MIPIVAFNDAAKNKKRIYQTIKLSAAIAVGIMLAGLAVFQLVPKTLLGLFEASDNMIAIGVPALRIISLSFGFAGFCIVISSVFQALGNGVYSLIMSVARQIIVILPVAFAFAKIFGLHAVWYAYPIAEIASVAVCVVLLIRILNVKVKPLEMSEE
jgi:Na+-driven multidrug efflux pump